MITLLVDTDQAALLDLIPLGMVFTDRSGKVLLKNSFVKERLQLGERSIRTINDLFLALGLQNLPDLHKASHFTFQQETYVVQRSSLYASPLHEGYVWFIQRASNLEDFMAELDVYKNLSIDLKAIFDIFYDVIYVSDGQGTTLRVSSACEGLWGYKAADLVGKTVFELEEKGVFTPSVTRLVLERKEQVTVVQTTKAGRILKVVGTPIMDEEGRVIRVVNASRDITEVGQLQSEIETLKQLAEGYRKELMHLRSQKEIKQEFIYRSEKMEKVLKFTERVAKVDSSVLVLGEPGVGKEVIASTIHKRSPRKQGPFITVHCGSIPSALLGLELFGSEEGVNVHRGSLETANEGTLFLDEIEEIPVGLQVKLLQAIQAKQLTRIGGSKPIKMNPRIIAATSADLEKRIQEGEFRQDLFYQLNVVPVRIPPLRERIEDIVPLILQFLNKLNVQYNANKKFNPHFLKQLQEYTWPGNVRELQNMIERLFVTAEGTWIDGEHLPDYMKINVQEKSRIQINQLMPLKEAVQLVEEELLRKAKKKYGSTTKIAEVLEVNQSTISRKLRRIQGV